MGRFGRAADGRGLGQRSGGICRAMGLGVGVCRRSHAASLGVPIVQMRDRARFFLGGYHEAAMMAAQRRLSRPHGAANHLNRLEQHAYGWSDVLDPIPISLDTSRFGF